MIRIDQYIRSLLFEHDCVIIPDLGGLLTRRSTAGYISGSGIYAPARKKLAFNEVLKLDDGLLIYTISIHEKITREEASRLVKEFVEKLRSNIAYREQAVLNGIGSFTMNQEGKLLFEPDNSTNFDSQWYGLTDVQAVALVRESEVAEEVVYQHKPFLDSSEQTEKPRKPFFQWIGWAAAAAMAGLLLFVGTYGETFSIVQGSTNPFQEVSAVNMYNSVVDGLKQVTATEEKLIKDSDPIISEPVEVLDNSFNEIIEEKPVVVEEVSPATKKYELIAGSFTTKDAAETLQSQLIKKGYTEAYIIDKEDRKFHKVVALGTDNINEAYTLRNKLEKIVGKGVWVFEDKAKRNK